MFRPFCSVLGENQDSWWYLLINFNFKKKTLSFCELQFTSSDGWDGKSKGEVNCNSQKFSPFNEKGWSEKAPANSCFLVTVDQGPAALNTQRGIWTHFLQKRKHRQPQKLSRAFAAAKLAYVVELNILFSSETFLFLDLSIVGLPGVEKAQ
uniref:Uncharacterized protein n=1 Tax=Micrurus lemniscatus lemniscatus TaxID=129467 RepID=A0A2D4JMP0_MICLE